MILTVSGEPRQKYYHQQTWDCKTVQFSWFIHHSAQLQNQTRIGMTSSTPKIDSRITSSDIDKIPPPSPPPPSTYANQEHVFQLAHRPRLRLRLTPKASLRTPSKFSALPLELRIMIWDSYLAHSRVVWIRWNSKTKKHTGRDMEHPHFHIPPILHVNRESRSYGLQYYTLAFAPSPDKSRIYFNYEWDWAYFNPSEIYYNKKGIPRGVSRVHFHNITRLYLEDFNFWDLQKCNSFGVLATFSKLDTIFIYNPNHDSAKFVPHCVFPPRDGAVEDLLIRVLDGMHSELVQKGEGRNRWPELLCSEGEECSLHCKFWPRPIAIHALYFLLDIYIPC